MPLYEFVCNDCNRPSELLVAGPRDTPVCRFCSSTNLEKQVTAPSSASGPARARLPGLKDTACCGSRPGQAAGCAGPGSCCGSSH